MPRWAKARQLEQALALHLVRFLSCRTLGDAANASLLLHETRSPTAPYI